jgi:hypothetical protein
MLQGNVLRHEWRQCTEGMFNLPRTLGDQKMGSLVPLERGALNLNGGIYDRTTSEMRGPSPQD